MSIVIENVKYIYTPNTPFESVALDGINLEIQDGEFVGLIGHTGSGKSTLIQLISGLEKITEGRILIGGVDYGQKGADRKQLRKTVGVVFQYPEYQLFEETIEKDISFGPLKIGISPEETTQRVKDAMALVGLSYEEYKNISPFELSGGQKRKVAIAGVLAMNPSILILDEPIAGLDPIGRYNLMELIKKLHQEGTTIIMISHNMDDLANYASRVIALKNGKVMLDGTPKEVFSQYEQIEEAGLMVPQATEIVKMLRDRGIEMEKSIITLEELSKTLVQKIKQRTEPVTQDKALQ